MSLSVWSVRIALQAVPVDIGERELRAGMGALAADEHARPGGPAGQIEQVGDLTDLPVGPVAAVLIDRANPGVIGDLGDRAADRLGEIEPDRVLQRPDPLLLECPRRPGRDAAARTVALLARWAQTARL